MSGGDVFYFQTDGSGDIAAWNVGIAETVSVPGATPAEQALYIQTTGGGGGGFDYAVDGNRPAVMNPASTPARSSSTTGRQ